MFMDKFFTDISSRHVEGKRLDKTVWGLLNFYAYVKYHVKVIFLLFFSHRAMFFFFRFFLRLLGIGLLTSLADKVIQIVHQRFYSEKDEEAFGKFG